MRNLWWWAYTEIQAPCEVLRELWEYKTDLEAVTQILNALRADARHVTMQPMTTARVDAELADKLFKTLFEAYERPQHKQFKLIGTAACGGVWDNRMTEIYFRAESFLNAHLNSEEMAVVVEFYERITTERKKAREH